MTDSETGLEIAPCPWCGWPDIDIEIDDDLQVAQAVCVNCYCRGPKTFAKNFLGQSLRLITFMKWNIRK